MGGSGPSRRRTRPCGEHRFHVGCRPFSLSHLHEGSHDRTNHLFEKPIRIELEDDEISVAPEMQLFQPALWILIVCRGGFKGREIVCADQVGGGVRHGFQVERFIQHPSPFPEDRCSFGSIQ